MPSLHLFYFSVLIFPFGFKCFICLNFLFLCSVFLFSCVFFLCVCVFFSSMFVISHWSIFVMIPLSWLGNSVSVISGLEVVFIFLHLISSCLGVMSYFHLKLDSLMLWDSGSCLNPLVWFSLPSTAVTREPGTVSLLPVEVEVQVPLGLRWHLGVGAPRCCWWRW